MSKIIIYTGVNCSYCHAAKGLLKSKNLEFHEIDINSLEKKELEDLLVKSNMRTVPQIFFGEELIGGFTELKSLNEKVGLENIKICP